MKLLKLTLNSSFRSLPIGFTVTFNSDTITDDLGKFSPFCLVGPNGSGKSNVLEVLAAIFYHLECIYIESKPDGFDRDDENPNGFDATISLPDAYELNYLTYHRQRDHRSLMGADSAPPRPCLVQIIKKSGQRPVVFGPDFSKDNWHTESLIELERLEVIHLLPELVVGYSSGENEVLSLPFFKMRFLHYDEYLNRLSNQYDYSKPEGRLLYLDNQYSQAVLLTNYLMQKEEVMRPVFETVGIKQIKTFQLIIQQNKYVPQAAEGGSLRAYDTEDEAHAVNSENNVFELSSLLETSVIKGLRRCATAWSYEDEILTLDYWVNDETRKAFQLLFEDNPLNLFHAFQTLLTLNLYHVDRQAKQDLYESSSLYVNETVAVLPSDKRIVRFKEVVVLKDEQGHRVYTKALSDGEHQFLHSLGICLLLKDTSSLFLLDEPETHFNPDWRAKFISTLRKCLSAGDNPPRSSEMLITSHSPFIVSDCQRDNVLIFTRGANAPQRPDFNTFGASVNQITLNVYGKRETIADTPMQLLKDLEQDVRQGRKTPSEARESTEDLADSVERMIFLKFVDLFQKPNL